MRALPRQFVPWPRHFLDAVREADGDSVAELESRVASLLGVAGAIAVDSGRQALALILRALDLKKGDRVAVPSFTFYAVPAVVRDLGLTPVFVDVDEATCNVTPEALNRVFDEHPGIRAAIVTHTFGLPARITEIAALCERRGVALIEDCAHAFGSGVDGRGLGSFGSASIFSLETSKQVNALGGGIAAFRDKTLMESARGQTLSPPLPISSLAKSTAKQAIQSLGTSSVLFPALAYPLTRALSEFGRDIEDRSVDAAAAVIIRSPARLHPMKAALALGQLADLEAQNLRRAELAGLLDSLLAPDLPRQRIGSSVPPMLLFTIFPPSRDTFARQLLRRGVDTKRDFLSGCSRLFGGSPTPVTSRLASRALNIPFHPLMADEAIRQVAEVVNEVWRLARPQE